MNNNNQIIATKDLLTRDNYRLWLQEIDLLLTINGVGDYIRKEKIKTVEKIEASDKTKIDLIKVEGKKNFYYTKDVTTEMLVDDAKAKYYLLNSISDNIKIRIDFKSNTAYQIMKIIKAMNTKSTEVRKHELKETLNNMRYSMDDDITLFITEMENIFNELDKINNTLSEEKKFNYLYTALPNEITVETGIIQHVGNWDEATKLLKNTVPHLIFLKGNTNRTKTTSATILNAQTNKRKTKQSDKYKKNNKNKNKRYFICDKPGHIAKNCWHNPINKNKNKHKRNEANNASKVNNNEEKYYNIADCMLSDYNSDENEVNCMIHHVNKPGRL